MLEIVGMTVDVPDMRDVVLFQIGMHALADADQTISLAATEVQEFQLFAGCLGISD